MPDILFPDALPDETIFSWLCRYHLIAAHSSFRHYTLPMLGINGSRPTNEFPVFLPQLSDLSGVSLNDLINHMRSLHYYEPFLLERDYKLAFEALKSGDSASLQSKLGMVANRIASGQYLKYCPLCVVSDCEKYGVAYWHKVHQLIGVLVCPVHNCHLNGLRRGSVKVLLPESNHDAQERGTTEESELSRLIADEFSEYPLNLTISNINQQYMVQLRRLGLQTSTGRVRQKLLKSLLLDKLNLLPQLSPAFQRLAVQVQKGQYPECLFYRTQCNHQPLKHFLLIYVLFGSWLNFSRCISDSVVDLESKVPKQKRIVKREPQWSKAIACLKQGESLRTLADMFSTTVSTLKIKAQQQGVDVNTRPSKVYENIERAIWRKLFVGEKTLSIATEFCLSVAAIEKVLTKHPELKLLRKRIWYFADFTRHQKQIFNYVQANKNVTRNKIKLARAASYIWLYKHEKEWLYQNIPTGIPRNKRYVR
ncbi:hypothetical protein FR932_13520 [Moritella marina ATCC 15381]|uniref:TniQ domain-containing protein n=1 Tax=Moritella marina ATCC 15381 TaxID=1202962 RepID=A0A5J6WLC5_MORMI|nr:TnsD family Tn7-like transposition protein [Moritella marina]QFI38797.1 hypothetical protein FR932_13520 [Moritella marina ATCC 15381]